MDVLCADKTGTLTTGRIQVHAWCGVDGCPSDKVLLFARLNATFETGFRNPIDEALRTLQPFDSSAYRKLDEEPYDFIRQRLSILLARGDEHFIVTKGALQHVLEVCRFAETADGS